MLWLAAIELAAPLKQCYSPVLFSSALPLNFTYVRTYIIHEYTTIKCYVSLIGN